MLCSGFSIVAQCHYQIVCLAFFKGPDRCKSVGANLKLWGRCNVTSDTIVISSVWDLYVVGECLCHGFQGNPLDMACSLCSLFLYCSELFMASYSKTVVRMTPYCCQKINYVTFYYGVVLWYFYLIYGSNDRMFHRVTI